MKAVAMVTPVPLQTRQLRRTSVDSAKTHKCLAAKKTLANRLFDIRLEHRSGRKTPMADETRTTLQGHSLSEVDDKAFAGRSQ